MLSPTIEGEPSPKTHKRIRKVLAVAPLLSVQSGLKSKPKPKAEANNSIEKVPEDHPDNIVHSKPFPPSGKNGRVFKKVVIADEKLEGPISFNQEEDRALIADILKTRTRLRAPNEIAVLQKAFSNIKFFEKIRPEIDDRSYEKIFQNLTLETFEPGQRVFNYDDIGRKFYIIITGSVYVLLNSGGAVGSETSRSISFRGGDEEDEISYQTRDKLPEYMAKNELTDSQKKSVVEKCYPGFWIVRTMLGGDSFGELALNKNSDGRRTATVICTEKTALGILTKEDYNNILGNLYERLYRDKLEFLSKIDIFSHWNDNQLSSIILNLEEIRVRRKNPVFKEGDAPDRVYFIRQGEIELQAHVDKDEKHEKGSLGIKTSSHFLYRSGTAVGIKNKLTKIHEPVKLGILTERSYFGESELQSRKPRDYTAIAYSSEVLLYSMTREKFLNIVKDDQSIKCLEKHINEKLIWREEMTAKFMNRVNTLELSDTVPTEEMSPKNILQKQNINDYIQAKVNSPPANPALVSGFDLTKSAGFWDDQVKSPAERVSVPTRPSHSPTSAQANKQTHSRLFEKEASPQRTDFVKHFSLPAKPPKKGISYLYQDRKKWLQENVPKGFDEDDFDSERVRQTEIEQNQSSFNFVKKGIPLTQSWKFDLSTPLDLSNPAVNPTLSPIAHDSHQPRKKVNPFQQKLKNIQTSIKSPRNLQPLNLANDPSKLLKSPTNHSKYSSPKESMISVSTIGLPKVSANIKGISKKMDEPQQQRLTTWEGHSMEKDFFAGESLSPKVQSLISSYKKISESAISNMKKKL